MKSFGVQSRGTKVSSSVSHVYVMQEMSMLFSMVRGLTRVLSALMDLALIVPILICGKDCDICMGTMLLKFSFGTAIDGFKNVEFHGTFDTEIVYPFYSSQFHLCFTYVLHIYHLHYNG